MLLNQNDVKEEIKLLRVGLSLMPDGFRERRVEWIGKETEKLYIVKRSDDSSDNRNIKKDSLLIPSTSFIISHRLISFSLWCFPEDLEKAKQILKDKVIAVAKEVREESDKTFSHIK